MERFYYGLVNVVDSTWKCIVKPVDAFMVYCEKYWNFLVRHYIITMCVIWSIVIVPPVIRWLF